MGKVNMYNQAEFEENVVNGNDTYLVDFWAEWCAPCRMMAPILDEFVSKQDGVKVAKVNVDENPAVSYTFGITGIPTMIVFKNGKEAQRIVGLVTLEELEKRLSNV